MLMGNWHWATWHRAVPVSSQMLNARRSICLALFPEDGRLLSFPSLAGGRHGTVIDSQLFRPSFPLCSAVAVAVYKTDTDMAVIHSLLVGHVFFSNCYGRIGADRANYLLLVLGLGLVLVLVLVLVLGARC
ncbi:hypothetical protein BO70DRAFT_70950 [Aspergillus heteromorphus CBS 117.55]|uniref:Uncharacterized protein n=1 Tax=Aspergillus heteromorphus CBS 117.55 TaxID=1448321 RepID=A0A317VSZ2_9EURO|nr:uncharacterized protein BO70DRAFT_70950 [Aspergillus heteromorphus CBS 117.55]PWY77035.1 hypothetical protein BO70DRAFT_70950 [Aspergillus heteromorphus CBS 117.55]